MPQVTFNEQEALSLGKVSRSTPVQVDTYVNPAQVQISTVTVSGFADGVYGIQIEGAEGTFQVSYTASGAGSIGVITAGLVAAFDADDALSSIVTATDNDPDVPLTFSAPGNEYVISFFGDQAGSLAGALTQDPEATEVGVGLAVVQGATDKSAALPTDGTTRILGITIHNVKTQINTGKPSDNDTAKPGQHLSVLRDGVVAVRAVEAVSAGDDVYTLFQNPVAGGEQLGELSGTNSADRRQVTGAYWRTSTTAAGLAEVVIKKP